MQRFTISRNGQTYGPYSMDELQRYLASGHVLLTDQARADDASEWLPVSQILANAVTPATPGAAYPAAPYPAAPYPPAPASGAIPAMGYVPPFPGQLSPAVEAPPNLNWILLLIFGALTCGLVTVIYELMQAAWLRRIYPPSRVLFIYLGALVFYVLQVASGAGRFSAQLHGAVHSASSFSLFGNLSSLVYLIIVLVARFTMRSELEQHYNTVEPIGLRLSGVMTFFFGSLYFQYHFNRINELKRGMLYAAAVPR